jgi:DNA-binding MarR family transcriptional regulator
MTAIEPMMMVRILDRMEADHLLERRADPADRRARRLYLTKKAKPLLEEIWRLGDVTRGEMFAGISKADRDTCIKALERMHENMCAFSNDSAASPPASHPAPARRAKTVSIPGK